MRHVQRRARRREMMSMRSVTKEAFTTRAVSDVASVRWSRPQKQLISRLTGHSALVGGVLAGLLVLATPVLAQQGNNGGNSPGSGGASSATGVGSNGATGPNSGGGAGAGVTGGTGGNGGGTGGATAGANGSNGAAAGSGGGGGAHGYVGATVPGVASVGGTGGAGAVSAAGAGKGGGGGGGGGYGAVITGTGNLGTLNVNVTGGVGGLGGDGGTGGYGGYGGFGGVGLALTGNNATLAITSAVTGGNAASGGAVGTAGGAAGVGGAGGVGLQVLGSNAVVTIGAGGSVQGGNGGPALNGAGQGGGGAGITGANLTLIVGGSVSGGTGVFGRENAVTFNGGTNVLEIQSGATFTGNVVANSAADTLRWGGSTNSTFDVSTIGAAGQFRTFGVFEKAGTSNWTLTGTSTYTGATTVNAGTLSVNGSIATSSGVTVNNGGTLGGTGTLPGTVINSGGTLAPGNSVGTLQVNGNLTLNAGSNTRIEVLGATIDRVNVTGTATLGGTVTFVPTGGTYTFNSPYTFLQAGTLTGTFATSTASGSFGVGVTPSVSYTSTQARLTLTPAALTPITQAATASFSGGGTNSNRLAIAGALDAAVARGQDVSAFFNLYNQTALGLMRGLDMTSGQVGTTATTLTVDTTNQFLGALLDPSARGLNIGSGAEGEQAPTEMAYIPGRATPAAPLEPRTTLWARAFGGSGSLRGDASIGSFAQTTSNLGIAVGADHRINPDLVVGLAMGGSSGWALNADGMGRATADTFQVGVYGATKVGQLQLSAATSYALTNVSTTRQISFAGLGDLTGRLAANALAGRVEAGWRMDDVGLRGLALTPFAAVQSQWVFTPRYAEGASNAALNPFALTYDARTNVTLRTELGLRTDYALTQDVALFTRAGWAADIVRDASVTAGLASLPGTSFTVTGTSPGPHTALGSLGFDWRLSPMTKLTARADGELSDRHAAANGSVRLQVRF